MGRYLLDASVLIDFSKGREPALSQVRTWIEGGDVLAVCQVVVAEFYTGLSAEQADKWRRFILSLTYWRLSPGGAMRAGQDREAFARAGKAISTADALIAAVAREQSAMLATGNVKDCPMTDITIFPILGAN